MSCVRAWDDQGLEPTETFARLLPAVTATQYRELGKSEYGMNLL